MVGTIAADLIVLTVGSVRGAQQFESAGWDLFAWASCVAIMGLASIQTDSGPQLGMDMPLLLATGFLYGPIVAGVVAFAALMDMRELRGQIPLSRALFNRAQVSLSVMAATMAFTLVGGSVGHFPRVVLGASLAVGVDGLVNHGLVISAMVLHERSSFRTCLRRLRVGPIGDFGITYLSFGLLSLLLAEASTAVGIWALVLFSLPTLLGRKALSGNQALETANERIRAQGRVVNETTSQSVDERRDERLAIAAGLHDEVLPPLYKVHLMGQVLGQDLASGRLLALEEDVPELIRATDEASDAMRAVIRSLRTSPIGSNGLAHMLRLLVRHLESLSPEVSISLDAEDSDGTPLVQLLAYQVAREAIRNALRHSDAKVVRVSLHQDSEDLRLVIEDDGQGFDPNSIDRERHFGIALMRERVELADGILQIDTRRGAGTRIIVRLPLGRRGEAKEAESQ